MHRILVPTDGSDQAKRATDYAIELAKESPGSQIHLITVFPEADLYGLSEAYLPKGKLDALRKEFGEGTLRPAVAALSRAGTPFTDEVCTGDIAATIVKRAADYACTGIVMGTRGMGAVGNLLLGSIASKVVHLSKVPVTLVP